MKYQIIVLLTFAVTGTLFGTSRLSAKENAKPIFAGGWTIHKKIDADMSESLTLAVKQINEQPGRIPAVYTPVTAAVQVVAGLNFCFLCIAEPEEGIPYYCRITFYVPLGPKKTIESIEETKIAFQPEVKEDL